MLRRSFVMKLVMIGALGVFAVFAWLSLPAPPRPAGEPTGHGHGGAAGAEEGVVVAVDRAAGRLTISHGPLLSLGMPAMTMGFAVEDPAEVATLQAGDKIRFHVAARGGALVATKIERVAQ
jgi:Cu(I)/Ag(I) efflux system protein CusF